MSKQAEAELILKLYDLRREPTMRQARDWFAIEFFPESMADVRNTLFGDHSAHLRMILSYWEMAAALVLHDAISLDLFNSANGEHFMVFSRLEPILEEVRAAMGAEFLTNLERLVETTPGGRERSATALARMKALRDELTGGRQQRVAGRG